MNMMLILIGIVLISVMVSMCVYCEYREVKQKAVVKEMKKLIVKRGGLVSNEEIEKMMEEIFSEKR